MEIVFFNQDHKKIQVFTQFGANSQNFRLELGGTETVDTTTNPKLQYAWRRDGNDASNDEIAKAAQTLDVDQTVTFGTPPGEIT